MAFNICCCICQDHIQQRDTKRQNNEKTRENRRRGGKTLNRDMDINNIKLTWWINHVDCRHGVKIR